MSTDTTGKPVCTIIGGPNGSGKSTIYDTITFPGRFVNADLVARRINPAQPEAVSIAAGRQTLAELERLIGARESFVYETTLSSHQSVELMRTAKPANYEIGRVFVMLTSAGLHVERVANSVVRGGHPKGEREANNQQGEKTGCHRCGTKNLGTSSGKPVLDHQPPQALNPAGAPAKGLPQCASCSASQGGKIAQMPKPPPPPPPPPPPQPDQPSQ